MSFTRSFEADEVEPYLVAGVGRAEMAVAMVSFSRRRVLALRTSVLRG